MLAEVAHQVSGLAVFGVLQGDNADFRERTLGVSMRLGDSPVRLRLAHRFRDSQSVVGVSTNTF